MDMDHEMGLVKKDLDQDLEAVVGVDLMIRDSIHWGYGSELGCIITRSIHHLNTVGKHLKKR
jgi:hypothetical protein